MTVKVAELYDRQTGAAEQTNRAAKHPNKLAEMRKLMLLPNQAFAKPSFCQTRLLPNPAALENDLKKNARFSS